MSYPTISGYILFLRNIAGINTTVLPDDSISIEFSFNMSLATVNRHLINNRCPVYENAVYNLATDILINTAQDQINQCYFYNLRKDLNINSFVPGVIANSNDQGTGQGLLSPEAFRHLTFSDLLNLKTSFGRAYLALAQNWGPSVFGIS